LRRAGRAIKSFPESGANAGPKKGKRICVNVVLTYDFTLQNTLKRLISRYETGIFASYGSFRGLLTPSGKLRLELLQRLS
jgi:hypothetical protein